MPVLVVSDGSSINFGDIGSGPPLLLIHGWMMSGTVWRYQQPLSASFRVITPDLRGHGNSAAATFTYTACVDDLVELIDHLCLDKVILAGWSMGSQILLSSWPKLKERVAAMVLVSGTPRFCAAGEYGHGLSVAEARTMSARLRRNFAKAAGEFFQAMFAAGEISPSRCLEIAREVTGRLPSCPVAMAALDELICTDLRKELEDITAPVLLLHGDGDAICPASASSYMLTRLGAAKMKIFAGSGHAPFLTKSVEFNRIVHEFAWEVYDRD